MLAYMGMPTLRCLIVCVLVHAYVGMVPDVSALVEQLALCVATFGVCGLTGPCFGA
jgi:hypothetical protein